MSRDDREAAYIEFVSTRRTHFYRIAYGLTGDPHRAEDLLQASLVKLYVAWNRVQRRGSEEAYVRQIMVRASIDESRRPWRREQVTETLPERPATTGLQPEDRSALLEALHELPAAQRAAVVLRHWLGLSVAETAREMGVPEGTVKSHTSRGLAALRETLSPTG